MKVTNYLAWAAGVIAGALIVVGILTLILQRRFFGVNNVINYFHAANTCLLVVICCLISRRLSQAEGK